MTIEAKCKTTAMGIMPHKNIDKALELALSLDIPFWPQLPKVSYSEDMYVQASHDFPGIAVDFVNRRIIFNTAKFEQELANYFMEIEEGNNFALRSDQSLVYKEFLSKNLQQFHAIRGQMIGPVSFGFNIVDENRKPIIYNDEVRAILFDFIQKKANAQYEELVVKNPNSFVWLDEPGLTYLFSGLSGYNERQAREDYQSLLTGLKGPKGLHLCANVNLPYLLELGVEILSFDAYQIEFMPKEYAAYVSRFIKSGGIISWGIVPTESTILATENPQSLAKRVIDYWDIISSVTGTSLEEIGKQSLLAPARCCLSDVGQLINSENPHNTQDNSCRLISIEDEIVEKAFSYLREISQMLIDKCGF
jgi:hypothetical protein